MKSHAEYLTFKMRDRMAFENITDRVEEAVRNRGVGEGLVLVNANQLEVSSRRWR